jgi:hypothetical protein
MVTLVDRNLSTNVGSLRQSLHKRNCTFPHHCNCRSSWNTYRIYLNMRRELRISLSEKYGVALWLHRKSVLFCEWFCIYHSQMNTLTRLLQHNWTHYFMLLISFLLRRQFSESDILQATSTSSIL